MKRKSLLLDEQKLDEARKLLGAKTDAETVNRALDEAIRIIKIRSITEFFGKGLWKVLIRYPPLPSRLGNAL